jgi:hypothetical protein
VILPVGTAALGALAAVRVAGLENPETDAAEAPARAGGDG